MPSTILAIESSCDDTSAAVVKDAYLLSNLIAGQDVHRSYGGVVPELASRAHQANIVPVVDQALSKAGVHASDIDAVAFTRGPGLLGSLLVGTSFAKGFALAMNIPLIEVNHLHAHVFSHWLKEKDSNGSTPSLPFLCLLVSGGHTQLIVVDEDMKLNEIGSTIDDAAGEAFDKCAKVMGLPYPGGPHIDRLASAGDPERFSFTRPLIGKLDYSFSGLKTNFLYFLRDELKNDHAFIEDNKEDLSASIQKTIIDILVDKLIIASRETGIKEIGIAGGVAANSGLRKKISSLARDEGWQIYLPERRYTTDNAAMIAITGYFKYLDNDYSGQDVVPKARLKI
ncbi:MAG TPA: tRNA (adenosine(37)-N6)-threonylcarbamoyltransferase complex transferase subunit TsaD [Bacteroidales bacterium]|nr:tRNA (adenosine(37)-N6)-threonylcarbamoyltransferase complex transferase subunit TsaD [Bacteroidales bacterium]